MRNALTITFKDTKHTDHLVEFIESRFKRLKKLHEEITHCTVTVKTPHRSHMANRGVAPKEVTVNIHIPGKFLTAKRTTKPEEGLDLYGAISDSFAALTREAAPKNQGRITYRNFRHSARSQSPLQYAG